MYVSSEKPTILHVCVCVVFRQEAVESSQAVSGSEGAEGVTDVIQQLLELSEQVTGESTQTQPPVQAIAMETAINQDILQVRAFI